MTLHKQLPMWWFCVPLHPLSKCWRFWIATAINSASRFELSLPRSSGTVTYAWLAWSCKYFFYSATMFSSKIQDTEKKWAGKCRRISFQSTIIHYILNHTARTENTLVESETSWACWCVVLKLRAPKWTSVVLVAISHSHLVQTVVVTKILVIL
jgi:hypothetical protein